MITVDWGTRIVSVPQSFLTFVSGSTYTLDTELFKIAINDIEDSEQGMMHPQIINHSTSVLLGGIEYARVLEIVNGYTITLENGSYVVNLTGSNNNILDVVNLNNVQVRSNNSAGLINLVELQFGTFQGAVHVDQNNGSAGTAYPKGTPLDPVNNFPDAIQIAESRGFDLIHIIGSCILDTGDDISGYRVVGQNAARTSLVINDGAETLGCDIQEAYVTGKLDGNTILRNCVIADLNYVNGFIFQCMINPGTISLGGVTTAHFLDCYSGVPGSGTPIIDMNGVTDDQDTALAMRGYKGGIQITEKIGTSSVSIDFVSGQIKIDPSCVAGTVVVRGTGKVIDAVSGDHLMSGVINGGLNLINEASYGDHVHDVWQRLGLDKDNPLTNNDDGSLSVDDITIDATPSGTSIIQTRRP